MPAPQNLYKLAEPNKPARYFFFVNNIQHEVTDPQSVESVFNPAEIRPLQQSPGYGVSQTSGANQPLLKSWQMQPEVIGGGLPATPELFARGIQSAAPLKQSELGYNPSEFKPGVSLAGWPANNLQGTTPYYGTLQDLASKGLQVSGGKVYKNGQIIGTYGGETPAQAQPGQPTQAGQFVYGADVLNKKANDAAVRTLYEAYFNRQPSLEELKNWGSQGGADTTVQALETFLQGERDRYGYKTPVRQLQNGQLAAPQPQIADTFQNIAPATEPFQFPTGTPGATTDLLTKSNDEITKVQTEIQNLKEEWKRRQEEIKAQTIDQRAIDRQTASEGQKINSQLADLAIRESIAISAYDRLNKIKQEEQKYVKTSVAPALYQELQVATSEADKLAAFQKYADKYGSTAVMSAMVTYQTDKQKQDLLNAADFADLLSKTVAGGEINVPGLGRVKIVGAPGKPPETLRAAGKIYSYDAGKQNWVDTGIKDDELTDNNILSAIEKLGDPDILKDYLGGLGIKIPTTGEVSIPESSRLAFVNNNPGNLKFVNQPGATLGENGFARFNTPEAGYQALKDLIDYYKEKNLTVSQFISTYAPPSENATSTYIAQFNDALGTVNNSKITNIDTGQIAQFMAYRESGTELILTQSDLQINGAALAKGELAPSLLPGFGQTKAKALAEAKRIDPTYNPSQAELKYQAAKRYVSSLNSPQMIRFQGLANSVVNTIEEVKDLSDKMKLGGIMLKNQVELEAYRQAFGNTPKGQLVSQYLAAVNTLKEEFANLANGGYAPTDAAWELANKQINENYGVKQLDASLIEIQRLINFRLNAVFQETSPNLGGGNTIKVKDKKTGQTGTIPASEFDANLYDKL